MDELNFIGCAIIYRLWIFSALLPQMHFRNRGYTWSGDFDGSVKLLKVDR
jgi:hypothetical protein